MKIPSTQKVRLEDFPEQRGWITPLIAVLNKFIQDTIAAVNSGIEFEKNILGVEKELDFVYISHAVTFPITFKWTLSQIPKSMQIVYAGENTPANNRDFASIMALAAWSYNDAGEVNVSDMVKLSGNTATLSDLSSGKRYKVRIRVTP